MIAAPRLRQLSLIPPVTSTCCAHVLPVIVLQEPSSIEKVAEIDEHIGCAMSGLTADAKTLIDHARADTQV
jgi:hypothetical protein